MFAKEGADQCEFTFQIFLQRCLQIERSRGPLPGLSAQYLEVSVRGKLTKFKVGSRRDLWGGGGGGGEKREGEKVKGEGGEEIRRHWGI
jgi:hypothetical protein